MSLLVAQFCALEKDVANLTTVIFYGMMSIIIPTIYVVVTANNLLARQVDDGSMAYVLSSPIKRKNVALVQMGFLVGSLFVTFLSTTLIHLIIANLTGTDLLNNGEIILLNLMSYVTVLAISGICFMFSGIFNRSKYSLGISGMISVFFILMSMMAMFGGLAPSMDSLKMFKFLTIITLCDNQSIMDGNLNWIVEGIVLLAVAASTYSIGTIWFKKKDLPL